MMGIPTSYEYETITSRRDAIAGKYVLHSYVYELNNYKVTYTNEQ